MMILFTLFSVKFSSVFYIIISGAVGIAVYLIKTPQKGKYNKMIYLKLFLIFS